MGLVFLADYYSDGIGNMELETVKIRSFNFSRHSILANLRLTKSLVILIYTGWSIGTWQRNKK